jgi:cleavage and polyadenylation specificity factor subunit 2
MCGVCFQGKTKQGFFKAARKAYPMFHYHEEKVKWDEYGEIIRSDFTFIDLRL